MGFVCTLCACQETLWDRSLCKAWLMLKHGEIDILVLFNKSLLEKAAWENCILVGGNWFWESLMCSFVFFCSLSSISEFVIEALKFTGIFVLIMYPQNRGTKTDLEYLWLLSHFSAAHRLDVLSQLDTLPFAAVYLSKSWVRRLWMLTNLAWIPKCSKIAFRAASWEQALHQLGSAEPFFGGWPQTDLSLFLQVGTLLLLWFTTHINTSKKEGSLTSCCEIKGHWKSFWGQKKQSES